MDSNIAQAVEKQYLGVPYIHRGRDGGGLDCWGLIIDVYKRYLGVTLLDVENYDQDWQWEGKNYFIEHYHRQWDQVQCPAFPDVVLFKAGNDIASHAGIVLDQRRFIHCARKVGVVIGKLSDPHWVRRCGGFYRYRHDNNQNKEKPA